ncbi:DEAD/DEAH box helicase [Pontibacillus yanchengensis]|uniref:DEAD/DEAH box helicase n=1 Tax=Pontibacillus yanchengensis TaxID=462910 RepID=A0A6I4ZZH0_9BACI|nr:DEAD/DEAH box helicase [Pontibacillus yanchengensis]
MTNTKSFEQVLDYLREISTSESDKGTRFENLVKKYFEIALPYAEEFEYVWTWNEFPENGGRHDTGIDLVAKKRGTGEYCAIQCKFYAKEYTVQKKDIDSFFNEVGKELYTSGIIVTTTDKWSSNASAALESRDKQIQRLRFNDLRNSAVDWSNFITDNANSMTVKEPRTLLPHQKDAFDDVINGFEHAERGKMIMACGTGKTFTSLKIAEEISKQKEGNSVILYLVPSISLLSQTLKEWNTHTTTRFRTYAVCSDKKVSKASEDINSHDIGFPATTDVNKIVENFDIFKNENEMTVIFSTYQSIEVIREAQEKGLPTLDLIIADEAHRTTGVTLAEGEESHFVKVHDNNYIKSNRRLYQTATPKVFGDKTKNKADKKDAVLTSMDDVSLFGKEFHNLGFGEAVERGLLTDYKVMVLVTDQDYVDVALANEINSGSTNLNSKDFAKIVGTWNGLSKRKSHSNEVEGNPMRKGVAFTSKIQTSKHLAKIFQDVVDTYSETSDISSGVSVEIDHVDGTMNTLERSNLLDWLGEEPEDNNTCRILSNARCLTEGVDVPDLDSVIFFNPRNSVIDIIQAVGRVMRKAEDKNYGYVILPININKGNDIETELNNNEEYKVVWQVLQALRSHDERFNAMINQMDLNMDKPSNIEIIGHSGETSDENEGTTKDDEDTSGEINEQIKMTFPDLEELQDAIYAQIVDKVGDKKYWENWSSDVAEIAHRHFDRIKLLLRDKNGKPYHAFQKFLADLRNNLNSSIQENEAIEMLSQHLITKPVFEALFDKDSFVYNNPVSKAMEEVLSLLEEENLEKETQSLDKFYESVKTRASKIDNLEGKQKVIIELYDKFFGTAFKKTTERLGIVYTPVEIVDFIIKNVNDILKQEFNLSYNDNGVHVLDPFAGTGTFAVRLLQSKLITNENLLYKYTNEIHSNEIVLLAYYIATINIEETFYDIYEKEYYPYEGMVLTDTFQLNEERDTFTSEIFGENNERAKKQNENPVVAIIGNPPYSARQRSANDNNANVEYEKLDNDIRDTYGKKSTSKTVKDLYDSYVRAIRWSSDRIKDNGIISFVTNGSFIDKNSLDGLRISLTDEFSKIYVMDLKGAIRGKSRQDILKEGGNVFDIQTGVAIVTLIKNSSNNSPCELYYYDIGENLSKEDKLNKVNSFQSIDDIKWRRINYNAEGDWVNQRNPEFNDFIEIGSKKKGIQNKIFSTYSLGLNTNRDAWVYNFSQNKLLSNVKRTIEVYNQEVDRYKFACEGLAKSEYPKVEDFVTTDRKKISWSSSLYPKVSRGIKVNLNQDSVMKLSYRPFTKQWVYYDKILNHRPGNWDKIFPTDSHENVVISLSGVGSRKPFAALVTDCITDVNSLSPTQSFPLYYYEKADSENANSLFDEENDFNGYKRFNTITDWSLSKFQTAYNDKTISKNDIFWYVYGILNSSEYKSNYMHDLKKMLPRIPLVNDFWGFSESGRQLGDLHLNYENLAPYPLDEVHKREGGGSNFAVKKMQFGKDSNKRQDKSVIHYNDEIVLTGVPIEAYEYDVNGRSPIEWIIDQYRIKTDKPSGIINDPNDYSENPRYIIDLLKSLITLSLKSKQIVEEMPPLKN